MRRNYVFSCYLALTEHLFHELSLLRFASFSFFVPFFFFLLLFPPILLRAGKSSRELIPDEAAQLNDGARVNPTINTKLFIALAVAAQQHQTTTGHSVCRATESDESRSTEEGLLNRERLFLRRAE